MRNMVLGLFLVFVLLTMGGDTWGGEMYKWVDEKGTLHMSDNPTSGIFGKQEKQVAEEDTGKILKKLEMGNRDIPRDMWKYGPAGESQSQPNAGQSTSGSTTRSGRG